MLSKISNIATASWFSETVFLFAVILILFAHGLNVSATIGGDK